MAHRRRRARFLRVLADTDPAAATCPDDSELARFLDRTLAASHVRALEAHFDRCHVCRELVFMLAGLDPEKVSVDG